MTQIKCQFLTRNNTQTVMKKKPVKNKRLTTLYVNYTTANSYHIRIEISFNSLYVKPYSAKDELLVIHQRNKCI